MPSLQLDGVELFYEQQGSGTPLLLIHGNGCTAAVWEGVIPQLAQSFRVIAHDRRGYGRTKGPQPSPKGYFGQNAEDAARLLETLGATPAVVVGWSGGGLVALHLALRHPALLRHLVLVEPPLHAKGHPTLPMMRAFMTLNLQRLFGAREAAARTFFRWATSYTTGGCAWDKLDEGIRRRMLDAAETTLTELDAGTGEELSTSEIGSLTMPLTCMVGRLTPKAIAAATTRLAAALPKADIEYVDGAAHMLHVDRPERFVEILKGLGT